MQVFVLLRPRYVLTIGNLDQMCEGLMTQSEILYLTRNMGHAKDFSSTKAAHCTVSERQCGQNLRISQLLNLWIILQTDLERDQPFVIALKELGSESLERTSASGMIMFAILARFFHHISCVRSPAMVCIL